MTEPPATDSPGSLDEEAPDAGGAAPPAEPTVDEIETGEHDLAALAKKAAEARKQLSGSVTVRRRGEGEVRLALEGSRTVIGRAPSCDIVIAEPEVSRTHAEIIRTEAGYLELRDRGSAAGVVVRGHRVERHVLLDGDRFQVGSARFTVHLVDEGDGAGL